MEREGVADDGVPGVDRPIRFISLFSGIEACSVAWESLGWECVAVADIDAFPSAVLAHRFPGVPNLGDITKVNWDEWKGKADLIVGGSPCQSFSIAGRRLGMDDPRGNLAIHYLRVVEAVQPRWFVYENVPGLLSSDGGRDFGAFLGLVGELGYGWAYRVLDAQFFGVPQRRRRVFVVGGAGADWRGPASVLFERESLLWDSPSSAAEGEADSPDAGEGVDGSSGARDGDGRGMSLFGFSQTTPDPESVTPTLVARGPGTYGREEMAVVETAPVVFNSKWSSTSGARFDGEVSPTLDAVKSDGISVAQPVATSFKIRGGKPGGGKGYLGVEDQTFTLTTTHDQHLAVPIQDASGREKAQGGSGIGDEGSPSYTLTVGDVHGVGQPVAFTQNQRDEIRDLGDASAALQASSATKQVTWVGEQAVFAQDKLTPRTDITGTMVAREGGATDTSHAVIEAEMEIRRLTPLECERLQGFPDEWTKIPWRGKPADECPDGPRYKACGNSMAVPVMRWIGEGIQIIQQARPEPPEADSGSARVFAGESGGVVVSSDTLDAWFS